MSQTTIERSGTSDGDGGDGSVGGRPAAIVAASSTDQRLDVLERDIGKRDMWTFVVLGVAILIMFASIVAIGLAQRDTGGGPAVAAQTVSADLAEYTIALSAGEATPGSRIVVTNSGTLAHNLGVTGTDLVTADIQPGDTATLDLSGLDEGDYELYCEIAGHAESGMTTGFTITAEAVGEPSTSAAAAMGMTAEAHAAMTPAEGAAMDQAMTESILAFPAETAGVGNQRLEPTVRPDGTKHFELTAAIVDWEVAPGEIVQAWAYNGQVPGPRLDLDVGDRVEVQITNDLPIGTDIHWHGIDVPNDQDGVAPITQQLVASGDTYTYQFTASEAAIGMYHAHAHGDKAIPNGLFGTLYIGQLPAPAGTTVSGLDIPADLTIAQDIPMVLNDAGAIGLSLNGKSFPATTPLVANENDWVKITYFNEGLQVHPMHLHGFEQIVYAKDGEPLDAPYAADTILIGPGERYTILFHADQTGTWVWHCHILNHVESDTGMFGMVTAVVVQ